MQLTELKNSNIDFHVKIIVPALDIQNKIEGKLADLSKTVKISGFRPGKVPQKMLVDKYGASVKKEVIEDTISSILHKVIDEHKIDVADSPVVEELKLEDGKDLEFIAKFEKIPYVELPDLTKIDIEKQILKLEEQDIDKHIDDLLELFKNYDTEREGGAKLGDQVIIDAVGYIDGTEFAGSKLTNHKLVLGSRSFIDNFEEQLVDAKAGDSVTVNVTFPNNYHVKDLAGKQAEFKVEVKSIYEPQATKLDKELLEKFGCKDEQELRDLASKKITADFSSVTNTIMKMHLFDKLENILVFEVPQSLLNREINLLLSQAKDTRQSDPDFEEKSEEDLRKYCEKLALRRVKVGLMISEYIKHKNIQLEQSDLIKAVMAEAKNFPGKELQIFEYYKKTPKALEALRATALEDKAVEHMFANGVNILEKEYSKEQLEKYFEEQNNRDVI